MLLRKSKQRSIWITYVKMVEQQVADNDIQLPDKTVKTER